MGRRRLGSRTARPRDPSAGDRPRDRGRALPGVQMGRDREAPAGGLLPAPRQGQRLDRIESRPLRLDGSAGPEMDRQQPNTGDPPRDGSLDVFKVRRLARNTARNAQLGGSPYGSDGSPAPDRAHRPYVTPSPRWSGRADGARCSRRSEPIIPRRSRAARARPAGLRDRFRSG